MRSLISFYFLTFVFNFPLWKILWPFLFQYSDNFMMILGIFFSFMIVGLFNIEFYILMFWENFVYYFFDKFLFTLFSIFSFFLALLDIHLTVIRYFIVLFYFQGDFINFIFWPFYWLKKTFLLSNFLILRALLWSLNAPYKILFWPCFSDKTSLISQSNCLLKKKTLLNIVYFI